MDRKKGKIQSVFDGSAKTRTSLSLNECLESGPNLNPDIMSVLLRFRTNEIAWMTDIKQAFLNIELTK